MNYLALCQRMILECAISGTMLTTVGQTGEMQRVTTWINQAAIDIQGDRTNWGFMRSSYLLRSTAQPNLGVSFATVSGQAVYPLGTGAGTVGVLADDFDAWIPQSFRNNTTANSFQDEIILDWVSYDKWRDGYAFGAQRSVTTRNVAIAVAPDNSICLGPFPNNLLTITGDYWRGAAQLTADADIPSWLPTQWHMAIVYRAMRDAYGLYEAAPEVLARAIAGYRRMSRQFGNRRGGMITAGRTLA